MAEDGTLTKISESYFKADVSVEDGGGEADLSDRAGSKSARRTSCRTPPDRC